jgi:radical SAM superfamily enzyme YgiQ (UPF0313 family)
MRNSHSLPEYTEPLYRPPSEASSLILQITEGCSHNKCTFCGMYITKKFKLKPVQDIKKEIDAISVDYASRVKRIFLADGDAVVYPMDRLVEILDYINLKFPSLERISSYVGSQEFVQKNSDDWKKLADRKLRLLYFGLESGNDEVLALMNKGHRIDEFKDTVLKVRNFIDLSIMVVLGGGGRKLSKAHALQTAALLSEINPKYVGLVTLFMRRNKNYFANIETPTIGDLMDEARMIISNINGDGITFRANHVSNFVSLSGVLPRDREKLVRQLDEVIADLKRRKLYDTYPEFYKENCQ